MAEIVTAADAIKELRAIEKDIDRATMYALRAAGRAVKSAAKRRAPQNRADTPAAPRGRLKASIHSSRRLVKFAPGSYRVHVVPVGPVVNLYRGKMEERYGFMAAGLAEGEAKMAAQFVATFERTLAKRGRI